MRSRPQEQAKSHEVCLARIRRAGEALSAGILSFGRFVSGHGVGSGFEHFAFCGLRFRTGLEQNFARSRGFPKPQNFHLSWYNSWLHVNDLPVCSILGEEGGGYEPGRA